MNYLLDSNHLTLTPDPKECSHTRSHEGAVFQNDTLIVRIAEAARATTPFRATGVRWRVEST